MSMTGCGTLWGGVTRCRRKAPTSSLRNGCSVRWGWCDSKGRWACVCESTMKPVGKPDAGNPHVRFDERGWEKGRRCLRQCTRPSSTLPAVPRLVSTPVRCCDIVSKTGVGMSADVAGRSACATVRSSGGGPKADGISLGVGEPGEAAVVRNIHLRHHHLAAEFLRLRQVSCDILHFDVENCVVMGLVPERGEVPLDSALRSGLNHGGRAHRCRTPAEERSVELAGLRRVGAADFEMHNWFCHLDSILPA